MIKFYSQYHTGLSWGPRSFYVIRHLRLTSQLMGRFTRKDITSGHLRLTTHPIPCQLRPPRKGITDSTHEHRHKEGRSSQTGTRVLYYLLRSDTRPWGDPTPSCGDVLHCQSDDPLPTPPAVLRSTSTPPQPVCSFVSYILILCEGRRPPPSIDT